MTRDYRIEILSDDGLSTAVEFDHSATTDLDAYLSAEMIVKKLVKPRMVGWRLLTQTGTHIPSVAVAALNARAQRQMNAARA